MLVQKAIMLAKAISHHEATISHY